LVKFVGQRIGRGDGDAPDGTARLPREIPAAAERAVKQHSIHGVLCHVRQLADKEVETGKRFC